MADNWTQSVVCRYFKNGICREGNNCRYRHAQGNNIHDGNNATTVISCAPPFTTTCRFFKHGICKFGSQCHFRHNSGTGDNNTAANTNSTESSPTLGQRTVNSSTTTTPKNIKENTRMAEEWVKAPEFAPLFAASTAGSSSSANEACATSGISTSTSTPISYAGAVNPCSQASSLALEPLCPYAEAIGICKKRICTYLHGIICELCGRAALHPHNEELQKKHTNACVKQHEMNMELAFAIQRSKEKSCGVCFETIMEKPSKEQRFGILPNCNHCFCLSCIRKWRQAKQFDNKIIRACPECRVTSDFVCPSRYWVDTKEEKEKIIMAYKGALSTKDCKYFKKGSGKCPFGNKCFYLHALPDGTKQDVGPPVRSRRWTDSEINMIRQAILLDPLEEQEEYWIDDDDGSNDISAYLWDTEDSDWSESFSESSSD